MAEQKDTTNKLIDPLYIATTFYMLRAPALPAQTFLRLATTGHISSACPPEVLDTLLPMQQTKSYQLLQELATQPQIMQALAIASPSLLEGLTRLQQGKSSPAQQKKVYAGLLRYILRMSSRPTPFGLFAGVASGHFASETQALLASPALKHFRTRPDMHWLFAVLRQIEEKRALVAQIKVRLNQTAYLVGERAVLPFADIYGEQDGRAISLRATSVVRKVFELAQQFISYAELQIALKQAFPRASMEQIERVLWQLWEHHFLISQLHPPLTDARPAEYVRKQLVTFQGSDELETQLASVLNSAEALDQAGVGAPITMISTLVQDQEKLAATSKDKSQNAFQVDAALSVKSSALHRAVGLAAAQAATFLLRQTPFPRGYHHLQEYRMLFLEKYGEQAEVPLLDLLSPESGLDAPPGYTKPPRTYHRPPQMPPHASESRDQLLQELVIEAVNRHEQEIELTEEIQQKLERWSPELEEAPLSLEIYLQLHASSCQAIDRGDWTAVLGRNCGAPNGGRTFGRFFDLLGESSLSELRSLATYEEALLPDVIFAELSYQPVLARMANIATRPPLRSYEIVVGTTPSVPPERVIMLNDLVVGIQHGRFYLRSLALGKQVRVCQTHMLNIHLAPNICRFITEIATDGQPALSSFDWGAAASSPFLPRLVLKSGPSGRIIISPACWQLRAGTIVPMGDGQAESCWFRGLQHWRVQWRVPRYVYLSEGDNRLLLDLEHPVMAAELRDELNKLDGHGRVTLDELLPDFDHLWLRDTQGASYFSEIVVPLLRADVLSPTVKAKKETEVEMFPHKIITPAERKRFPGEDWVYLKLYAALGQHEELLGGPMRDLVRILQEQELIDRWFFIRYADPEPHLRLRFHAKKSDDNPSILNLVFPWCLQLARRGLIQRYALDTYEREIERYGGPAAMDLLEQVFMVDSVLAGDLLAFQYNRRLTLDPLAVAVFSLNHFFTSWGCDFQQCLAWTHAVSEKYAFSHEFRSERKHYCDLLSPRKQLDSDVAEQRALLLALLQPHEAFLSELGAQVRQSGREGKLWVSETSLMRSLAHMHVNRLLGIDRARETQVYAFWRHTLDSLERRPDYLSQQV